MEIQFLGATKTVTGSKYLLKSQKNVMVDCGLFQGLKDLRLRNRAPLAVDPKTIDAVVLTHAHLDHSGYLPVLVKNGFSGKIYGTPFTIELCKILLLDSGHLQEEEAYRANKYAYTKHKLALPLYTQADAEKVFSHFEKIPFYEDFTIGDLKFNFRRAGHIFGSASILVKQKDLSVLFSGDLGRVTLPCIPPPDDSLDVDYLVLESTYGDRLHKKEDPEEALKRVINRTIERGGTVIIPAFAVGRSQSILYYIYRLKQLEELSNVPIFLDSPMAKSVTDMMLESNGRHYITKEDCAGISGMVRYVNSVEESKEVDRYAYPKIIVSASGMATGGRVLHHIKAFGGDNRNTILFAGYQALGTRGDAMLKGKKTIKIHGKEILINAEIFSLSNMSAHADYKEIFNWLDGVKVAPKKVFITHGEPYAAESLAKKLGKKRSWECVIPEYLHSEDLF